MGIRVKVTMRDKVGKDFRVEEKKYIEGLSERDTRRLAEECSKIIQETIIRKSKDSKGYMGSFFYPSPIVNGWGVGDVAELDSDCPWWYHQEVGSVALGANWQHKLPPGHWVGGRWVESEGGYSAIPQSPLPAKNYIADTLATMELLIPQILKENK